MESTFSFKFALLVYEENKQKAYSAKIVKISIVSVPLFFDTYLEVESSVCLAELRVVSGPLIKTGQSHTGDTVHEGKAFTRHLKVIKGVH